MILANFMDSALEALDRKGNLASAPALYNPGRGAEKVVHFTPWPGDIRYAALFADWRVEIVPYLRRTRAPRIWWVLRGLLTVWREMRRQRVDVVRARLPYLGALVGCTAARLLGIPSVVSLGGDNRLAHDLSGEYPFGSRRLSRAVEWLVLRGCTAVIAPNAFTRDYVARVIGEKRAADKVEVIPWIVERAAPADAPWSALGLDPGRDLVLVAGFLNTYKHTDVLYDVCERLRTGARPGWQVAFCGDGPLRSEGEERFRGDDRIRFLGWQPRRITDALLAAASVVLVPMSGFVLLEAAAAGRPVIAGNLEWHGELIEDDRTGFLVPPRDVGAWADRIGRLLGAPLLRRRLGDALRQRFDSEYDPDRHRAREIALYKRLTSRPAGPMKRR